jgi:hypothetical protein
MIFPIMRLFTAFLCSKFMKFNLLIVLSLKNLSNERGAQCVAKEIGFLLSKQGKSVSQKRRTVRTPVEDKIDRLGSFTDEISMVNLFSDVFFFSL